MLESLLGVGSTGGMLWCFADYSEHLWPSPPCDEAIHERFFGMIRSDGSLTPHTDVVRRFAARRPRVQAPTRPVDLDVAQHGSYADLRREVERLYRAWRTRHDV